MVRLLQMFFPVGDRMPSASSAALIFKMLIPHRYIANIQSQEYRPWIGCSKSDIGDRDTVWFVSALHSHCRGQRFESAMLHQIP